VVILRPTTKLRKYLPVGPVDGAESDTALGDWYVNRVVVDRRPLLLLVSSTSLLAVVVPARNVRELPGRIAELVGQRLGRLGVPRRLIDAELRAMAPVRLAKTENRSVLGIMVDFAKMLPHTSHRDLSDRSHLMETEEFLWGNPCFAGKSAEEVVFPRKRAPDLLRRRWDAG
jgi:hypothetical protein